MDALAAPAVVVSAYAVLEDGGGGDDSDKPAVLKISGPVLNPMRAANVVATNTVAVITVLGEPVADLLAADGSVCLSAQNQQLCVFATCVWLVCFTFGFLLFAFRGVI